MSPEKMLGTLCFAVETEGKLPEVAEWIVDLDAEPFLFYFLF